MKIIARKFVENESAASWKQLMRTSPCFEHFQSGGILKGRGFQNDPTFSYVLASRGIYTYIYYVDHSRPFFINHQPIIRKESKIYSASRLRDGHRGRGALQDARLQVHAAARHARGRVEGAQQAAAEV